MTLPKLVNHNRILVWQLHDDNLEKFRGDLMYNQVANLGEVRLLHDCCISDLIILDLTKAKIGHLMKIPPALIPKAKAVMEVR